MPPAPARRNALTSAGEFLTELHERPAAETIVQGLTFYEVLTPTVAQGGRARNVVPDSFQINVNYRFAPARTWKTSSASSKNSSVAAPPTRWCGTSP